MPDPLLEDFESKIAAFVDEYVREYQAYPDRDEPSVRIIHDPVWGSNQFHSWEMAILDSPLLQRLRLIKQVGLGHYVYPTARHSRFDHTLGMVSVVSRIARGLNSEGTRKKPRERISESRELELRMAAILHDVGHCMFSHVSERIYSRRREFIAAVKALNDEFGVIPRPHEVMAYYIVKSRPFVSFFNRILADQHIADPDLAKDLDLDYIAGAIIGCWRGDRHKWRFLVEIVNGPLDADKLDYLARDAQFAGLSVVYDFNRYMVTIETKTEQHELLKGRKRNGESVSLRLPMKGATSLEQILISKMMLYSYLYHQQKVVAAEAMLLEHFEDFSSGGEITFGGRRIRHPVDLLYLTDESLEVLLHPEDEQEGGPVDADTASSRTLVRDLAGRRLVKRALVISRLFIEGLESQDEATREAAIRGFTELERCLSDAVSRSEFRRLIHEKAVPLLPVASEATFTERDILIAWPSLPDVSEAEHMVVPLSMADADSRPTVLTKLFPLREWAYSYSATQWKGYIFSPPGYRSAVQRAAKELIEDKFGIRLTDEATAQCGVPKLDEKITPKPPPDHIPIRLFEEL